MIPVAINPALPGLALAGAGASALRRLAALREAGAADLAVFAPAPEAALRQAAAGSLRDRLPDTSDLAALRVLWITGLPDDAAAALAERARTARVLVNVEDRPALCDFHSVAEVRRGDLLLTVSTNGRSPALAARIRARLAAEFGPEWRERLRELGERRLAWRREGRSLPELARLSDRAIDERGWLA